MSEVVGQLPAAHSRTLYAYEDRGEGVTQRVEGQVLREPCLVTCALEAPPLDVAVSEGRPLVRGEYGIDPDIAKARPYGRYERGDPERLLREAWPHSTLRLLAPIERMFAMLDA